MRVHDIVYYVIYGVIGFIGAFTGSIVGLGGGVLMIPLLYLTGINPKYIVSSSKTAVFANSLISTYRYSRRIRIPIMLYLSVVAPMMFFSYIGAYMVAMVPVKIIVFILSLTLFFSGLRLMVPGVKKDPVGRKRYYLGFLSGSISGFIAGLTGIGGGAVNLPLFLYVLGLEPHVAVSLSMASILPSATASVIRHYLDNIINPHIAAPILIGALIGGYLGPHVSLNLDKQRLRRIIGLILLLIFIYMFTRLILHPE